MSPAQDSQYRTIKAKKGSGIQPPPLANPGHSGPTTFFLRSEKEVDKSTQRGRKASRESASAEEDSMQKTPMASMMGDSGFGVQSLEDTINSSNASDNSLSRTESNNSEAGVEAGAEGSVLAGRKRKAGNPVHPKIAATGQRILSSEHARPHASGAESPMSLRSAESPLRVGRRRGSISSSSISQSQPLTPLKMSPQPASAMPSTPRSGSPKSFRLSDEEASIASDTGSQAVQSSSGEEDDNESITDAKTEAMPQLVMPSITMPARRPFTEKGKQMGRLKVMVVGARGIGKTSLIQNICRVCEDIVHMDPISEIHTEDCGKETAEIGASTRPYPPWWTDFETRRQLIQRKSIGEGVLERNLTFIDTPGIPGRPSVQQVLHRFKKSLSRTASMELMGDMELISMLSGEGGVQIDAVIYLFDPAVTSMDSPEHVQMDEKETELLRYLCKWTNVVPLIGRADTVKKDELLARKKQLIDMFESLQVEPHISHSMDGSDKDVPTSADEPSEPFTVSSALGDDPETIDASILMSSGYLPPLVPSELEIFVGQLLDPDNMARLRHLSATKFLLWRQENLGTHLDLPKQMLLKSPHFGSPPTVTSSGSMPDEPSKVLVPHGSSSYFRSTSPSASDSSALSGGDVMGTSAYALARYNDNKSRTEPFRQVRLAKWAQDLQRSLDNERRRYKQMYLNPPSEWASDSEKASADPNHQSLIPTPRPARGRLGGDLGIIDPRDPLGVLAMSQTFRRRGWFALQIAGSCGFIGAVAWWVVRNWVEVQEFLGVGGQGVGVVSVTAVPAPTRGWVEDWREVFGWGR